MRNSLFTGHFDEEITYDLYVLYCQGQAFPDELARQLASLVARVFHTDFTPAHRIDADDAAAMQSDALEQLYTAVRDRKSQACDSAGFQSYLWVIARNSMLYTMRTLRSSEFDLWEGCAEPDVGRIPLQSDSEQQIYLKELCTLALSAFKLDVRFQGREAKACVFIAACFLGLNEFDPMAAQARYRLTIEKTRFLIHYTRCVLQRSIYVVREIDANA